MADSVKLVHTCMWRRLDVSGLERFELLKTSRNWVLRGTILVMEQNAAEARYEIMCDSGWRTRQAKVWLRDNHGEHSLSLGSKNARWQVNGKADKKLTGCVDIDLGWSPSTNTLPIRRVGLAVGEASGPVTAAWVSFPDLRVQTLPQEYRRLSENVFRYTSRGGAFQANLRVDEHGVVVLYEGLWERVERNRTGL